MTDEAKRCVEALERNIKNGFHLVGDAYRTVYARSIINLIESLCAELEQVKRERDAAVEDLRKVCQATEACFCCKSHNTNYTEYVSNDCMDCIRHCNWQWRGVNEDREVPTCQ